MYFITRVVLHRIDGGDDYTDLHTEMKARGFSRSIMGDNNILYGLPPAEYVLESDTLTAAEVRDLATAAVNAVIADETVYVQRANRNPSVLVTASQSITWTGLKRVFARK